MLNAVGPLSCLCLSLTAEELQAKISPIQRFVKGVRHLDATFEVEGLVFPPTSMYSVRLPIRHN